MRLIAVWFFLVAFFGCSGANAGGEVGRDIVSGVVCNVVKHASGTVAQAIATLVLIITGYSFFVGKVSIGMLFIVAAGIMFVFGAPTILGWIIGSEFKCKENTAIVK